MGEWVYYSFVAGSFLSKKLCSRLHSIEVDIYSKKGKVRFLNHPLGDLEVTRTCTSSIARWKARVRLPIRHNWTFSLPVVLITVETLHAEICRRERFLKGVGTSIAILGGKGRRPPTTVGWQKTRRIALMWYINIAGSFFGLVTKHACDGRMDRITTPKTALA